MQKAHGNIYLVFNLSTKCHKLLPKFVLEHNNII